MSDVSYMPKLMNNPVITRTSQLGLNPKDCGSLVYFNCPNSFGEKSHLALYRKGVNATSEGEFMCPTCHITHDEIMKKLGFDRITIAHCAKIVVNKNLECEKTDVIARVLQGMKTIYRMNGALVRVDPNGECRNFNLYDCSDTLSRNVLLVKHDDVNNKDQIILEVPKAYVKSFLNRSDHSDFEEIKAVVRHPLLSDDGRIKFIDGYDEESKIYFSYDRKKYEKYNWDKLTKEDAEQSVNVLKELFSDFPFADEVSKSAAIVAILESVFRMKLNIAPAVGVIGNSPGVGKSYFCQAVALVGFGRKAKGSSIPNDPSEFSRFLLSKLRGLDRLCLLDNAVGRFDTYPAFNTCITEEEFQDREVRKSVLPTVKTNVLFLWNGNNLSISKDASRRSILIRLHEETSEMKDKKYQRDLHDYIVNHIEEIQMHALRIVAAYIQGGAPECGIKVRTFSSWDKYCRMPVLWLGFPEPVPHMINLSAEDELCDIDSCICEYLFDEFGDNEFTASMALERIEGEGGCKSAVKDSFRGKNGYITSASVGRRISALAEMSVNDFDVCKFAIHNTLRFRLIKKG